ncbi:hypothetical protein LTR56_013769 [Elasticomyces elasticus]|nr:hypothetical protein LTR56_013769 [Elasticomyces elasticus]KAK3647479.1 hypothetical protein LTR22_013772 [Elasticomyces elasticus]KAK4907093.1 hypothetical protein LTR49_023836 [Elasticomyces elasticus]KAK5755275.1 hypothetical protein LTS12_014614 [Elasticomyces elasticus]
MTITLVVLCTPRLHRPTQHKVEEDSTTTSAKLTIKPPSAMPYTKARPLPLLYRNPYNNIQTTKPSIPPTPNLPQASTLAFKVITTRDIMENINIILTDTSMCDAPADDFQLSSEDWTTAMDEDTTIQDATSATSVNLDDTAMADDTIVDNMEISSADDTTVVDEDTATQEDDTDMSDDAAISSEDCTMTEDDASVTEQTHTATSSPNAEDDTLMVDATVDDSVDTIEALLKSL